DKAKGRRTLVIILGKEKASKFFIVFPALIYSLIISGIIFNLTPLYALSTLLASPLIINVIRYMNKHRDVDIHSMDNIVKFSRMIGLLLLLSFILSIL
ncbi:MAG: prenyltransferase, partial [Candidatus Nitrosothermus koennekii]